MTILINGKENNCLATSDRAIQYGDGLFETIAVKDGQCEFWHEHMSRLADGCERLKIPIPDTQKLLFEAQQLCSNKEHAVLKIIVTRGSGGRGYRAPEHVTPTRILSIHDWPKYSAANSCDGIELYVCQTRLAKQPMLAGIKHLNRLEQVIARSEWQDSEIDEGLMLDAESHVIEGTMSNCFAVINNELVTPKIEHCGVAGIMRSQIIKQATLLGMIVQQREISLNELLVADELFVCNSIIKIWPVKKLLKKKYKTVGNVTKMIMNGLI